MTEESLADAISGLLPLDTTAPTISPMADAAFNAAAALVLAPKYPRSGRPFFRLISANPLHG